MVSRSVRLATTVLLGLSLLLATAPSLASERASERGVPYRDAGYTYAEGEDAQVPYVLAQTQNRDNLDMEEHGGYSTEYIFGMTKGLMRSTLEPALKPVVMLLTVPLDIVFLPFAAIGGFFR